jgi:hypothetical protein
MNDVFIEYINRKISEATRKRDEIKLPPINDDDYMHRLRVWWCYESRRSAYEDALVQYKLKTILKKKPEIYNKKNHIKKSLNKHTLANDGCVKCFNDGFDRGKRKGQADERRRYADMLKNIIRKGVAEEKEASESLGKKKKED